MHELAASANQQFNWSLGADSQLKVAASRLVLPAGQLER